MSLDGAAGPTFLCLVLYINVATEAVRDIASWLTHYVEDKESVDREAVRLATHFVRMRVAHRQSDSTDLFFYIFS